MLLGRVFISSVFGGLLDLRAASAAAARLAGLDAVLTETLIAQPTAVRDALTRELSACDTYLGLFDRRRGAVPPAGTMDHRAITEEEFRLARELGLRCLIFLSQHGEVAREPALEEFLEREVTDYSTGVWTRPYTSEAGLRREIVAALSALRPRVVLSLGAATGASDGAWEGALDLRHLGAAWTGPARIGPLTVDRRFDADSAGVLAAFLHGDDRRIHLDPGALRRAGAALAATLPPPVTEALDRVLELAAGSGRLVVLEVRTAESWALRLPWELLSLPAFPLPVYQGLLEVVRRVVVPGAPTDPTMDPGPSPPADDLGVLGFTASPTEDQSQTAGPGASGLTGDSDLFWEQEQERLLVALDGLLRERRGQLILPDTGDREELRRQLARQDRLQLVHIACHDGTGSAYDPLEPVLHLEDADGHRSPLCSAELLAWSRATPGAAEIELLVLAASSTHGAPLARLETTDSTSEDAGARLRAPASPIGGASAAPPLPAAAPLPSSQQSFAERLVKGGLPRVLAMQCAISDMGATAFAEGFYRALGEGADLPAALRAGRTELGARGRQHEWAAPILLTGRATGPLAAPAGAAAPEPTSFDRAREAFAVSGVTYLAQGYVGRRDAERRLRRALVRGERLVVVHGLGGIGKSTFSARFLERRRAEGARVLVVAASCRLTATALAAEVAAQLGVERTADQPQELAERCFREALGRALAGVTPTFLLLDNLEDNQDGEGRFCDPALAAALVDLGTLGGPGFRVLASSRLALVLPPGPLEPWNLDLGELSLSGCRKIRLLDREGLGSLDEAAWRQTLHHLGGHPKALELLGGYLRGHPDRARRLLREMDSAVEAVANKLAARQDRGRSLLLDAVLEAVPEDREPALDRLCLLTEPLPSAEIEALLTAEGLSRPAADLDWLRAHGFLARTVAPSALEGGDAVHRLLASRRQGALAAREGEVAARDWHLRIALHLVAPGRPLSDLGAAARHRDAAGDRAGALRLWSEWAATLRRRHAYLASAQLASQGLAAFPAGDDEGERAAAASLWLEIHQGLEPLGAIEDARAAIEKALALTAGATAPEALYVAAGAHLMKGRDQIHAGAVQEARSALEKAAAVFGEGGHAHDRAVALGSIADLLQQCGQLDEALRIRRDEQLPVFEALGDARMCAVTLGGIAEILQGRGQFDEALHIRRDQQIPVFEAIGDLPGRAIALGKIANILQLRGELDEALRIRIEEQLPIFEVLGDVRSHAYTLGQIAEIFRARGDLDEALRILREQQVPVLEALGDVRARAVALGEIANVLRARGELDEALWIRREQEIPAYETLGDVRSRAVALSRISEIYQLRGELEEAVRIVREEVIPVYEALGDVRELLIGRTNLAMGLLLRRRPGDAEEARHLLTLALPAAEALRLPEVLSIRALLAQAARGTSTMRKLMRRLGRPLGRGKGRAKRRR